MNDQARLKEALLHFGKFLGVGGAATLLQYALLLTMVELFALKSVLASSVSYVISALFNYILNYRFTFQSTADHKTALLRFSVVAACGLGINSLIMYFLTEIFTLYYLLAQVVATLVVLVWNFSAHRYWTYKNER